ncbi:MAG: hypothetical protein IIU71_06040, partial [Selenomonadaceae bacterium]|nr:hypothetical protein [Selenomonadaceae bacterium]
VYFFMFLSISDTFQPLYANETIIVYMFTTVNTLLFVFNVHLCADIYISAKNNPTARSAYKNGIAVGKYLHLLVK